MSHQRIPPGWTVLPLIDLCIDTKRAIVDGPFGSNLKTIHYRTEGVPIITSGFVTDGRFIANDYIYVDEEKFHSEIRSKVVGGDIVMAKIGARCGTSAIMPVGHPDSILSGNALKISIDPNKGDTKFVWYYLQKMYDRDQLIEYRSTGAQPAISIPILKKLPISLPPLPEQRKIAAILSTWDRAIDLTQRLIAAKQRRKQALMQRLLTGKVRFPGFQEDWEVLEAVDFMVRRNEKYDPKRPGDALPCIELEHISQESGRLLGTVPSSDQASLKAKFSVGDVLFGKLRPYLRKHLFARFDGVCSTEIWVLTGLDGKCLNEYLYYLVQSNKFITATNVTSGTKMPRADWNYIKEVPYQLPKIEEQRKIVQALSAADREIAALEQFRGWQQDQKKGLMQQLLTGKIRVKVEEE